MDDKQYVEALEPAVVILGLALAFCLVAGIAPCGDAARPDDSAERPPRRKVVKNGR